LHLIAGAPVLRTARFRQGSAQAKPVRRHSTASTPRDTEAYLGRTLGDLKESAKVAAVVKRLKNALLAIEGRALVTQPQENRRAIDLEWVYRRVTRSLHSIFALVSFC
jgi:Mg-chelatase subunit ChlI